MTVRSILNEESDYSEENKSGNEDFRSTILQTFQFEREQEKSVVMRAVRKKKLFYKIIMFQLSIRLHIRVGNLNWCKCRHCAKMRLEK